ncbi:MAG: hypothetical protein WCJ18_04970 [Planctomycetota bacterium]
MNGRVVNAPVIRRAVGIVVGLVVSVSVAGPRSVTVVAAEPRSVSGVVPLPAVAPPEDVDAPARKTSAGLPWLQLRLPVVALPGMTASAPATTAATLQDIRQINADGFGTASNKYAFSMAVFNGDLYVGTLNVDSLQGMLNFFWCRSAAGLTEGAEIWRYGRDGTWTRVVDDGLASRLNLGVRKLAVIGGLLYAVTANHDEGMEVWRTRDGSDWERVAAGGFGDCCNTSGRGLCEFAGWIYVGTENRRHGAQLWRSRDGRAWQKVCDKGIEDAGNVWLSDFTVFDGRLYMGTLNTGGLQLYRTADGSAIERVKLEGVDTTTDIAALKLCVFKGRMFVGTMDFLRGFDLYATADGDRFRRVMRNGFNDRLNAYCWQLQEYQGRLYAGTYNHHLPVPFGEFTLLSSADGDEWLVEDEAAFGNAWQYGVRTMTVLDDRLIIGTATARHACKVFEARGLHR